MLRALPDEAFDRVGTHNRRGILAVGSSVKDYIDHVDHHLAFLLEKRARLEKLRPSHPDLRLMRNAKVSCRRLRTPIQGAAVDPTNVASLRKSPLHK